MRSWMIAFSVGIILGGFVPLLPPYSQIFLFLLIPLLSLRFSFLRLTAAYFIGIFWCLCWAQHGLQKIIPTELEGQDIWVSGTIVSLPQQAQRSQRFEFVTTTTQQKFLLNDYEGLTLKPNQQWQLKVRLKRPHGFANPGGFDYEGWLFQKRISATGYIRSDPNNRLLAEYSSSFNFQNLRYRFSRTLEQEFSDKPLKNSGLIKALSIGDRYNISDEEWALFTATGTNHLIVISGLHVGLVAVLIYRVSIFLFSLSTTLLLRIPAKRLAAVMTIMAAFIYAGLAGFSLPATRAFIMVATFMLGQCLCRHTAVLNSFCLALGITLFFDPLAPQASGFWLSFGAVGVLIYLGSKEKAKQGELNWLAKGALLIKTQCFLFIGLFPLMLLFFHQVSWLAPLVNLIAIPYVSLLIVPLCLLGLFCLGWFPKLGVILFIAADFLIEVFKQSLERIIALSSNSLISLPSLSAFSYLFLVVGIIVFLTLPYKTSTQKALKCLPLLLLVFVFTPPKSKIKSGEFIIDVLDVGQGLAVVISTENHHLIYDAGPEYSPRFNAGSGLLLPFIQANNIQKVDKIIVSHGDNDHAGGLPALLKQFPSAEYLSADLSLFSDRQNHAKCQIGQQWQWDNVQFEFPHPDDGSYDSNNSSCVLKVSAGLYSVLLSGDIENRVERKLVRNGRDKLRADILLAPHHGSQTSSTSSFISAVAPEYVVFSSGYLNRFNHPHPKVRARYEDSAVQILNTAQTGAISFTVSDKSGVSSPKLYRNVRQRYWSSYKLN